MNEQSTIHASVTRTTGKQREMAQAQPRPSRVRVTVSTHGIGESRLVGKQAINFGAFMLDEPTFSFGVEATGPIPAGQLPQGTAIVLKYLKNSSGLWTGAEVGFKIASTKSDIKLRFSLTFEGTTLRSTEGTGTTTTTDAPRGTNYYTGTTGQQTGGSS